MSVDTESFGPWSASQVSLAGANPGDFTVSPQSCTQQVFHIGQPCLVAITFHPTGTGLRSAELVVTHAGHAVLQDSLLVQGASGLPASPAVTERVSLGPLGAAGVGPTGQINANDSVPGSISSNGRYVTFVTTAKLDPGDNNGKEDVYVRDHLRGTTTLVSATPGGSAPTGPATFSSSISGDGRYIALSTVAKLTTDPADNHTDRPAVYVLDRGPADANGDFTGAPVMHVVGQSAAAAECDPDISGDGSQVTYWTSTPLQPLPAGQVIPCSESNITQAVVVDEDGNGNGIPYEPGDALETELTVPNVDFNQSRLPRISADGLHVVFEANELFAFPEDSTATEAWVYDRRITGSGAKDAPGNTRYVLATTGAFTPLVAGDNRLSPLQNTLTSDPVVSGDGSVIAYDFRYSNSFEPPPGTPLVLNSPLPADDDQILFVRRDAAGNIVSSDDRIRGWAATRRPSAATTPAIPTSATTGATSRSTRPPGTSCRTSPATATGLCTVAVVVDIDAPGHAGAPQLLGPTADPGNATGMPRDGEFGTALSGDGRFAVFGSFGSDLLPPGADTNNHDDVFLHELRPVDPPIPANVDFGDVPVGNASPASLVQFTTNDFGPAPVLGLSLVGANPGDFNILGTTNCSPPLPGRAGGQRRGRAELRDPPSRHAVRRLGELHADGLRHSHRDTPARHRYSLPGQQPRRPRDPGGDTAFSDHDGRVTRGRTGRACVPGRSGAARLRSADARTAHTRPAADRHERGRQSLRDLRRDTDRRQPR